MKGRETAESISDRAAEWVARIDRSEGDPEVRDALEAWLDGDERRRGAYFRARSAWAMLDRASVLGAGRREEVEPPRPISRRRLLLGGGLAGLAVLALGLGLRPDPPQRIDTAVGEIRRVPLEDGSSATANTGTELAVTLRPGMRRVRLDRGEAWFEVAQDRSRPFVVEAGNIRVKAVGTAFALRRTETGADVRVTEGVVEVWRAGAEADRRRVAAGGRVFVSHAGGAQAVVRSGAEVDRSLAWRSGQLVFDGETLAAAAAEFNRYNLVQVRVDDPVLAKERFVGRFRTNEPEAFARAAATILGARARFGEDEILLSRR